MVDHTLNLIRSWGKIYSFLVDEKHYQEPSNPIAAQRAKRILVDSDTFIYFMKLYERHHDIEVGIQSEPYTIRSFAIQLAGKEDEKELRAKMAAITRCLRTISEEFGLVCLEDSVHQGKRRCIKIGLTETMLDFFEKKLFDNVTEVLSWKFILEK